MTDELTVERGAGDDPREALKAQVQAKLVEALEKKEATPELAEADFFPLFDWEIIAYGPFQTPWEGPGRIIEKGQKAYVATVVMMTNAMCRNMAGFGGKVELSYVTSDLELMEPVDDMDFSCCIEVTQPCGNPISFFVHIWELEPTRSACILETNICARICNCKGYSVPGYAGFVRWVYDLDPEWLWPAGVRFDHPIRYLVFEDKECNCKDNPC